MNCYLKKLLIFVLVMLSANALVLPVLAIEEAEAFSLPNFLPFSNSNLDETASSTTLFVSTASSSLTIATSTTTTPLTTEEFCQKLEEAVTKLETSYLERQQNINANLGVQNQKIQEERQKYDDQRAWLRLRQDYYLKVYFDRLNKIAESDLQKEAIEQYKKKVNLALEERRLLTDLAVKNYRLDLDNLKSKKMTEMESRLISYEEKLGEEIQKAVEMCGIGDGIQAENSLQNRLVKLRQGREKIFKDIVEAENVIISERDRQVAEAEVKYKKAVEQAKEDLVKFLTVE
ncbi:MAG: hypothetical protein WCX70_01585 [Candidatus Paceibacterota bacterium]|jgi:hypothetical protein